MVFSGRLSAATQPWLRDHVVGGTILLPGAAFLELAVRAADEVGCAAVEDLTLAVPLVLDPDGAVVLQLSVGEPGDGGRRELAISSRTDDEWVRHATGTLVPRAVAAEPLPDVWPPAGAVEADLADFYVQAAEAGFAYGPAFQGLQRVWRSGAEVYADLALPADVEAGRFGLHPALLDAALQAIGFGDGAPAGLPFVWTGVTLHASGASRARVRITPAGGDSVTLALADDAGKPVLTATGVTLRAAAAARRGRRAVPAALDARPGRPSRATRPGRSSATASPTRSAARRTRTWRPRWRRAPTSSRSRSPAAPTRLLRPTRSPPKSLDYRAVPRRGSCSSPAARRPGPTCPRPPSGAWSARRSPRTRAGSSSSTSTSPTAPRQAAALATGEPQLALRDGTLTSPASPERRELSRESSAWDADGTVLITGGTGGAGRVFARHLVGRAARGTCCCSAAVVRRPTESTSWCAELAGADVRVVACDVADRAALAAAAGGRARPDRRRAHRRGGRRRRARVADGRAAGDGVRAQARRRVAPARTDRGRPRGVRAVLLGRRHHRHAGAGELRRGQRVPRRPRRRTGARAAWPAP